MLPAAAEVRPAGHGGSVALSLLRPPLGPRAWGPDDVSQGHPLGAQDTVGAQGMLEAGGAPLGEGLSEAGAAGIVLSVLMT